MSIPCVDVDLINTAIEKKLKRFSDRNRSIFTDINDIGFIREVNNNFGEKLIRVDGNIPKNLPILTGNSYLFISYDQSKYLHSLHKYPAKYFPELPRWLIEKYTNSDDWILDPFAGSGTTNLEALLQNRNSVAIDIEEFSRMLINVKTTKLNNEELNKANKLLISRLKRYTPDQINKLYIPEFPYRDNWFMDYIIKELAFIKQCIAEAQLPEAYSSFYLICMSSIVRSVSNADDNCTRTVVRKNREKNVYPLMAISKFIETILINTYKMSEYVDAASGVTAKIDIPVDSDALQIKYPDGFFNVAITSPPYVNAVDYPRTHQLELYWLGLENGSLKHLKEKHVGTECVSVNDYNTLHSVGIDEIDAVLEDIYQSDKRRSYIAYKYLMDMETNLKEVHRVLKQGGRYIIVVGNNRIRKVTFESWKYLMLIADRCGYHTETWFASEIIKHFIKVPREERIDRDYIIVLQKEL